MAIPPRTQLKDLDDEEKVSLQDALGDTIPQTAIQGRDFTSVDGVPIPKREDLETPEAAADWAQREIVKATPRAAQEVIHQLRKGGSKERMAAALQLLERAGVQAKQQQQSTAPVIILTPKVIQMLPWLKGVVKSTERVGEKVIEGEVIKK